LSESLLRRSISPSNQARSIWSRKNRLDELNTDPRSFPPSHAAIVEGCVVEHKIEGIRNSDRSFHFEAGAPVRQVEDHTVDHCLVTFEDDLRSLENALSHVTLALLRQLFYGSIFRRGHCGFFHSFQGIMPDACYALVFQDRQFLLCRRVRRRGSLAGRHHNFSENQESKKTQRYMVKRGH
jgi:hypothetical protein